jgi:hypothetical protein
MKEENIGIVKRRRHRRRHQRRRKTGVMVGRKQPKKWRRAATRIARRGSIMARLSSPRIARAQDVGGITRSAALLRRRRGITVRASWRRISAAA